MKIALALVLAISGAVSLSAFRERCYYDRETVDGLNKICYYSCASGSAAITVKSHQLCPLSIQR